MGSVAPASPAHSCHHCVVCQAAFRPPTCTPVFHIWLPPSRCARVAAWRRHRVPRLRRRHVYNMPFHLYERRRSCPFTHSGRDGRTLSPLQKQHVSLPSRWLWRRRSRGQRFFVSPLPPAAHAPNTPPPPPACLRHTTLPRCCARCCWRWVAACKTSAPPFCACRCRPGEEGVGSVLPLRFRFLRDGRLRAA